MQRERFQVGTLRGKVALGLLTLALLMRLIVPAGWMPTAGNGYAITLCTGAGTVSAWIDADGKLHKGEPADTASDHSCAFAGFAGALDLPATGALALPILPATAILVARPFAVDIGRGLAAPPPPQTGPPATL
jgi:hypothetical protein